MAQNIASSRYDGFAQALHWLTAIFVIVAWSLGEFDEVLPKGSGRAAGLFIHISIGLAILAMLVVRIPWQVAYKPPPQETTFGEWMTVWTDPAARIAHFTMYVLLVAVPITGIVLQFARGDALPIWGIGAIASPWTYDKSFAHNIKEIHEVLANALIFVAGFHAVAVFIHHFVFRDPTFFRMLPWSGKRR